MKEEKKKVLFILHLPPPVHGASMVGQYIKDSLTVNYRFECRFINLATAASLEDIGKMSKAKVRQFMELRRRIINEIKDFKPDVVYITPNSHGNAFYKDFLVVESIKRRGCKVIAHFHNKGVSTNCDSWLKRTLYRIFFHRLQVILLSDRLYPDIQRFVKYKNVHILHNGIPEVPVDKPTRIDAENDLPRLVFISNLLYDKGIIDLLQVADELRRRGYKFVCDIIGAEADLTAAQLQSEIDARNLGDIVKYHGAKYGDEKHLMLDAAHIFVFPTRNEAFPLVCIEAMQHCLPVVTTDEGGIPDIVLDSKTGYVCPSVNTTLFADRIAKLLDNKELRSRMGLEGRLRYINMFTVDNFERKLSDILNNI